MGTLPLLGVGKVGAAPPAGFTLSYRGRRSSDTSLTTYTETGLTVGSASADRIVIVALYSASAGNITVSSVTIGGVTATQAVANGTSVRQVEFWYAQVPSGTTADVSWTYSGAASRAGLDWWTITGTTQTTYSGRASATAQIATATSVAASSFTVPTGGCGIAATLVNSATDTVTWSQTSGSGTERSDAQIGSAGTTWGSAYDTLTAGSQVFTATGAESVARRIIAISWGP